MENSRNSIATENMEVLTLHEAIEELLDFYRSDSRYSRVGIFSVKSVYYQSVSEPNKVIIKRGKQLDDKECRDLTIPLQNNSERLLVLGGVEGVSITIETTFKNNKSKLHRHYYVYKED